MELDKIINEITFATCSDCRFKKSCDEYCKEKGDGFCSLLIKAIKKKG